MAEFMKKLKVRSILFAIAFGILLTLYSYFWADTVMTSITDAQMTKVDGRFMIATPLFLSVPAAPPHGGCWLTVLDVGQGLAAVVRTRHHALLTTRGRPFRRAPTPATG